MLSWDLGFHRTEIALINNLLLFLIHRRVFIRACSGGLLCLAQPLSGYCSYHPSHHLVTPYVGHSRWHGILHELIMGERDCFYYVDARSPEDGIIGELDIKNTELCDDFDWIRTDWELNCARRMGFAHVETI